MYLRQQSTITGGRLVEAWGHISAIAGGEREEGREGKKEKSLNVFDLGLERLK